MARLQLPKDPTLVTQIPVVPEADYWLEITKVSDVHPAKSGSGSNVIEVTAKIINATAVDDGKGGTLDPTGIPITTTFIVDPSSKAYPGFCKLIKASGITCTKMPDGSFDLETNDFLGKTVKAHIRPEEYIRLGASPEDAEMRNKIHYIIVK